ncbi:hypothetical protein HPP92_013725 [Vanilla planifolia]|uniref:Bidirectional sugar transporter SWEET n=1 Tax=Vanilla planifolia TaxID=51239 RepID=A0A835QQK5_VANPL|nr:hypothetical protein HPP92_013725 [Vanilla planifolia]
MATGSFIVGLVGNVVSILVFASPIGTFRRVVKKKSTENFKWQPYVTTLLSTSLWTFYGLLKPDGLLVVTVNATGSVLQAIYVALYVVYAPNEIRINAVKCVGILNIGVMGTVILVSLLALQGSLRLVVVGFICAALTVGMYAAPLSAMRLVVKTKSVEYMPFSLSFFLFLNGGIWSIYAALIKDYFIGVPNSIGFALGLAQLVIYIVYKRRAASARGVDLEKVGEDDSARLVGSLEIQSSMSNKAKLLNKGSSFPKASLARENSFKTIIKTLSLPPYELQSY